MALCLAPFFLFPLLIPCLGLAFRYWCQAENAKKATMGLFSFCFGYFVAALHWIGFSILTDIENFWWFFPIPVLLLPAFLAALQALLALPLWHYVQNKPKLKPIAFALCWLGAEWLRGWLFTGLPWAYLAHSFAGSAVTLQLASLAGTGLLTAFALLFALIPWYRDGNFSLKGLGISVALALSMLLFGVLRLANAPSMTQMLKNPESIDIALIQPNNSQGLRVDDEQRAKGVLQNIALSQEAITAAAQEKIRLSALLWPEAAIPYDLQSSPELRLRLAEDLLNKTPHSPPYLITGGVRVEFKTPNNPQWQNASVYNSMLILNRKAEVMDYYDKKRLVPFGEYIPFRALLKNFSSIAGGLTDSQKGQKSALINALPIANFIAQICYEGVFPVVPEKERAQWILNLTNDGWFGLSAGPYQHLAIQRLRAVEAGLPLVRVSNPGISAVFDQFGRQYQKLSLNERGFVLARVPMRFYPVRL